MIVKAAKYFSLGEVNISPTSQQRLGINVHIMLGGSSGITEEEKTLLLTHFPLCIKHFERFVNISTCKSHSKICAYAIDNSIPFTDEELKLRQAKELAQAHTAGKR